MMKKDRKRVSKDGLELAAQPEVSGPPGEASEDNPPAHARRGKADSALGCTPGSIQGGTSGGGPGGDPRGEKFSGIEDLAGRIQPKRKRVMISIRLDAEVLNWYRSIGKGYQSYIGELLAAWKRQQESQTRTHEQERENPCADSPSP